MKIIEKTLDEKSQKIIELENLILEQKSKLACENYWNNLVVKENFLSVFFSKLKKHYLRKKIREMKKSIEIYEEDKKNILKSLYKVTQELIRQTNVTIDQSHTINLLSNEIQRLEANLQAAQEHLEEKTAKIKNINITKITEEIIPKMNIDNENLIKTELDEKLEQYVKDQNIPINFEKISEGQYRFGTRTVQAKFWKDKLAIRMGGG